jgi:hypothetical protein
MQNDSFGLMKSEDDLVVNVVSGSRWSRRWVHGGSDTGAGAVMIYKYGVEEVGSTTEERSRMKGVTGQDGKKWLFLDNVSVSVSAV